MIQRPLGRSGISVPAVSFGAGPVSGLMTGSDWALQLETVARALRAGIDWFDTAAGYGDGASESNLGRVLGELGAHHARVATKVRVPSDRLDSIPACIEESVAASLKRLRRTRVTLLQLHNGITLVRDSQPASITPDDVLGPVDMAFRKLKEKGLVQFLGLTGTGEAAALRAVVRSGRFDTLQVPFNILNQSAGVAAPPEEGEADYGNIIADCGQMGLGVYAIRVFAGGAILGQAPSAHTLRTPFFPLALFERDLRRAEVLHRSRGGSMSPAELSVRFVLSHPHVSSALIGFGCPAHVDEIARLLIDPTSPSYPEDRI